MSQRFTAGLVQMTSGTEIEASEVVLTMRSTGRPRKRAQTMPSRIESGTAISAVAPASSSVLLRRGPMTARTGRPEKEVPKSPSAALDSQST